MGIRIAMWLLAVFAGASVASTTFAQSTVGPNGYQCAITHPNTGQRVMALHTNAMVPFWAMAQFLPMAALISYSPTFYTLHPVMQRLTQHHECGHLDIPTSNEFEANCYAIRRMADEGSLTTFNLTLIRNVHCSIGMLGPQYGGSGAAFWHGTRQVCQDIPLPPC